MPKTTATARAKVPAKGVPEKSKVARPKPDASGQRQVTVVIRPNVRDRWSSTLLSYYTLERCETVARGALSGSLYATWQMFDLMEQTWPELSTCMNELKDQAISEILENYSLKAPLADKRKPDAEAVRRRDIIEHILGNMTPDIAADENDFEDTLRDLFDMVGKCISVLEMNFADDPEPAEIGGQTVEIVPLVSTKWVNPRYYGYPMGEQVADRLMLNTAEVSRNNPNSPLNSATTGTWQDFPKDKFIIGLFKQKSGHPVSGATFRVLLNLWAMSNFTWEWYLNFVQIFGVPLRIAKVDPNADDSVKLEIDSLLAEMGSTGYIRLPNGNEIEIKEAAKSGDNTIHQALLKYCDEICRKRILGQTLTGGEGQHGTQALGKVHANVRNDRIQTAAKRGVKILNTQVIPAIGRANFGDARLLPKFETPEKDNEDPLEKMQRVQIFTTIAPMSKTELYDIAGFQVPDKDEETIGGPSAATPPNPSAPGGAGIVGQPKLPTAEPPKLNPEKDAASTAQAAAAEITTARRVSQTLAESFAPVLQRVQKISAAIAANVDDETVQAMCDKLLKDYPHIAAVVSADDTLKNILTPALLRSFIAGLSGKNPTTDQI